MRKISTKCHKQLKFIFHNRSDCIPHSLNNLIHLKLVFTKFPKPIQHHQKCPVWHKQTQRTKIYIFIIITQKNRRVPGRKSSSLELFFLFFCWAPLLSCSTPDNSWGKTLQQYQLFHCVFATGFFILHFVRLQWLQEWLMLNCFPRSKKTVLRSTMIGKLKSVTTELQIKVFLLNFSGKLWKERQNKWKNICNGLKNIISTVFLIIFLFSV